MTKGITDIDEGTIRRIDWQELLPVSMLVRVFSMALSPVAICLSAMVFSLYYLTALWPNSSPSELTLRLPPSPIPNFQSLNFNPITWFEQFARIQPPGHINVPIACCFALVFIFLWLVFARSLAVRLASTQRSSFFQSLAFAARKFQSVILALLLPGIVIGLCWFALELSLRMEVCGWFLKLINHVMFPLFLGIACLKTFLILLTICAFPLVIAAVATEASDGFDAFSRAVSYLTQRPLHYIFYILVALLFCTVGTRIFTFALGLIFNDYVRSFWYGSSGDLSLWMTFWQVFFASLITGYVFYFTICASTAIYFMLRRSVDGTPMDHFHSMDSRRPSRKLQPILRDAQGAPVTPEPIFHSADQSSSSTTQQ